MTELRHNLVTQDWVIIATERAKRPDQFSQKHTVKADVPCYDPKCPFCPNNEELTGPESFRLTNSEGWLVRAVPNKFPALQPVGDVTRQYKDIHRSMSGIGYHEVIIENRRHDLTTALLTVEEIANILRVYRLRYTQIKRDHRMQTIIIFKNHGAGAGTSLEHPHSQITATPIVPRQLRTRAQEAMRYYDDTGECVFCHTLLYELNSGERIVHETKHFVAFVPYAALSPFHTWIFPRRHVSSFEDINSDELKDLALILKVVLSKLYHGLNNPDYNYMIRSIPTGENRTDYFHWYLAIIPRVTLAAGFELGSGMFINTSLPEESAEFLRSIDVPI
jgi:UDPglucose--hexose-1-phosphate uridylyltransferase